MTDKQKDLCVYRFAQAGETIKNAKLCVDNRFYKDAINRAYYAAFYAVKAILAISDVDFKRHKDVVAYFNQYYVATDMFSREVGRRLARLQKKRETSDYDDFYVASAAEAEEQLESAKSIVSEIEIYLQHHEIIQKDK